jgi:4'-phosphopantetheinyl transferase
MIEVHSLQIPKEMSSETFLRLLNLVSVEKCERIKKFKRKEDRYRTLIADILIRSIVSVKYGMSNEEINYIYNLYGKPFLDSNIDFSFNVSHSGSWVVAITGTRQLLGIDIEKIKPIEMEVAKRFFAAEEYEDLKSKEEQRRLSYFYDLWTLKESFIKAIGRGMVIPLDSFVIKQKNAIGEFSIEQKESQYHFFFKQYHIDSLYKLSVCATIDSFPESINIYNFSNIYNQLITNRFSEIQ